MRSGQCNHRWMKRSVWTLSEIDLIWLGCREKTCDLLICAVFFALIFARFHDGSQETSRFCPSSGSYWWTRDCRQAHACAMDFRASVWKTWQHDTMIPSCCILCWLKDPVNCGRSLLVEAPTLQELNLSFEDLDKPLLLSRDHGSELSEVDQENASAEFCCTWPRSTWVFFWTLQSTFLGEEWLHGVSLWVLRQYIANTKGQLEEDISNFFNVMVSIFNELFQARVSCLWHSSPASADIKEF